MTVEHYLTYVGEMKGLGRADARRQAGEAMASCSLEPVARPADRHACRRAFASASASRRRSPARRACSSSTSRPPGSTPSRSPTCAPSSAACAHQRTVILSTHILSEVEATCDRVIIIHRGRVLALDTPANLNRRLRPTSQVHLEVRGPAAEVARALRAVPGVLAVEPVRRRRRRAGAHRQHRARARSARGARRRRRAARLGPARAAARRP